MTSVGRAAADERVTTPRRILMKGNEAMAEAAVRAGCDAYFGYPITPQAELLEWMARRMTEEGRAFVQAESELGAANMALGAAAAGARVLLSTSGPGMSLMSEAMSYMAGQELPVVLINVMRGGPGLGNIAPSQSDYSQATRGHGHGDYRVPVLAPGSIPESIGLMALAFEIAERYRTPVIVLTDGLMGQAMEPVEDTFRLVPREEVDWALTGAQKRAPRVIKSVRLGPADLEEHNLHLQQKFARMAANEVRWAGEDLEDAEYLMVAYGTAARICEDVLLEARERGLRVGLFRPITLWPFPERELAALAERVKGMLVVELSAGQMLDDVRLSVEGRCPVEFHGRMGGVLPSPHEILAVLDGMADPSHDAFGPDPASLVYADPSGRSAHDGEPDPTSLVESGAWWVLTHGGSPR